MTNNQKQALRLFAEAFDISIQSIVVAVIVANENPMIEEYGTIANKDIEKVREILSPKD